MRLCPGENASLQAPMQQRAFPPIQGSSSKQALLPITPSSGQITDQLIVDILDTSPSNQLTFSTLASFQLLH
jgi:hypothetical protein